MMKKISVLFLTLALILFMGAIIVPAPKNLNITLFLINLDNAKFRLKNMQKKLSGLKFTRVSAIEQKDLVITYTTKDGKKRSINNLSMNPKYLYDQKTDWNPPITVKCSKDDHFTWTSKTIVSPGEYGCACSHRKIWKDIVRNKLKYAIIVEDDAHFTLLYKLKLHFLRTSLPKQFDFIDLKTQAYRGTKYNAFFEHFDIPDGQKFWGTEAYIVSYEGAKTLLEITSSLNSQIDLAMGKAIKRKKIKAFLMTPLSKISKGQEHVDRYYSPSIIR